MLKRLAIPRAYEAVHEALEDEILSGRLIAGQPLPTESELADQFGVTRHTVREGMRVLEQTGLVQRGLGRRLHVSLPRYDELAPRASRALLMQKVSFRELWEISLTLEVRAAELAVERCDDNLVAALDANVKKMEAILKRGKSVIDLDIIFHTKIAEASLNRALLLAREPVSLLFYPSLTRLFDHPKTCQIGPRRLIDAHARLVQAFRERDVATVITWMTRHMTDFRRGYEYAGLSLDDAASLISPPRDKRPTE